MGVRERGWLRSAEPPGTLYMAMSVSETPVTQYYIFTYADWKTTHCLTFFSSWRTQPAFSHAIACKMGLRCTCTLEIPTIAGDLPRDSHVMNVWIKSTRNICLRNSMQEILVHGDMACKSSIGATWDIAPCHSLSAPCHDIPASHHAC